MESFITIANSVHVCSAIQIKNLNFGPLNIVVESKTHCGKQPVNIHIYKDDLERGIASLSPNEIERLGLLSLLRVIK